MLHRRLIFILILTLAVGMTAAAQPARTRGAYSPGAPYAVPGGAVQPRGTVFVVNTTADTDRFGSAMCDPVDGAGLTLREAIEECAATDPVATIYVPAGQYDIVDDIDITSFTIVSIIGEDPLTTIINNTHNGTREAGHGLTAFMSAGVTVSIANLTIVDSDGQFSASNFNGGGLLVTGGEGTLVLSNIVFDSNIGCNGGGVSIEDGPHVVVASNLTFVGNVASGIVAAQCGVALGHGGGLFFYSTLGGNSLSISDSLFEGNQAVNGGGMTILGTDAILTNVEITGNSAAATNGGGAGGGMIHANGTLFLIDSEITLNTAGADVGGAGTPVAGGLFASSSAQLLNSVIEDNRLAVAGTSPDCYADVVPITLNGGSRIGNSEGCGIAPSPSDVADNMLVNGGFEFVDDNGARAGGKTTGWNLKNMTKRTCDKGAKIVSDSGECALSISSGGQASQSLDLTVHTGLGGDILQLYARGKGKGTSTTTLTATATFSDGTAKSKAKIKFTGTGGTPGYDTQIDDLVIGSDNVSKLKVAIKTTGGAATKQYVDAVYLVRICDGCVRASAPAPAAASALRGF